MLGDKKRQIQELQERCYQLELANDSITDKYHDLLNDISKIRKELDERKVSDNVAAIKEAQLNRFKDNDGMYNYQAYKQKKMGLGGQLDEGTK